MQVRLLVQNSVGIPELLLALSKHHLCQEAKTWDPSRETCTAPWAIHFTIRTEYAMSGSLSC